MKKQELVITCIYTKEGQSLQQILNSSFTLFLKENTKG